MSVTFPEFLRVATQYQHLLGPDTLKQLDDYGKSTTTSEFSWDRLKAIVGQDEFQKISGIINGFVLKRDAQAVATRVSDCEYAFDQHRETLGPDNTQELITLLGKESERLLYSTEQTQPLFWVKFKSLCTPPVACSILTLANRRAKQRLEAAERETQVLTVGQQQPLSKAAVPPVQQPLSKAAVPLVQQRPKAAVPTVTQPSSVLPTTKQLMPMVPAARQTRAANQPALNVQVQQQVLPKSLIDQLDALKAQREQQSRHFDQQLELLRAQSRQFDAALLRLEALAKRPSPAQEPTAKRQKSECAVCLDQEPSIVLVPCGHLCVCGSCALALPKPPLCPLCRIPVVCFQLVVQG
jgi:hypothetical protein